MLFWIRCAPCGVCGLGRIESLSRLVAWVLLVACAAVAQGTPPNIVVILADDLGWRDLGCMGSTFYETPNLERLAEEGMKFTRGYAASPVCSPTRVSMMTGKHPARLGTTDWFGALQPEEAALEKNWHRSGLPAPYVEHLPLEEVTIAEALRAAGYATMLAGKWHLGDGAHTPENQGFEVNLGGTSKGQPASYFSPYQNPRLKDGPVGEHLEMRLAGEVGEFIRAHRSQPFYVYYPLYLVHTPLQARADLVEKYERKRAELAAPHDVWGKEGEHQIRLNQSHATYAAMVQSMDDAVGVVLRAIEDAGLREETLVVFTSDNGGLSTAGGLPTSNVPLRAGKGWLYEGGIRVPWLVRWPGKIKAGTTCATPVFTADLYPTLLTAAGLAANAAQPCDGLSLLGLFRGEAMESRALYWHYPHFHGQHSFPGGAMIEGEWKLIRDYETERVALYNLGIDIGEQHDLASSEPERVASMNGRLSAWLDAMDAKFPTALQAK